MQEARGVPVEIPQAEVASPAIPVVVQEGLTAEAMATASVLESFMQHTPPQTDAALQTLVNKDADEEMSDISTEADVVESAQAEASLRAAETTDNTSDSAVDTALGESADAEPATPAAPNEAASESIATAADVSSEQAADQGNSETVSAQDQASEAAATTPEPPSGAETNTDASGNEAADATPDAAATAEAQQMMGAVDMRVPERVRTTQQFQEMRQRTQLLHPEAQGQILDYLAMQAYYTEQVTTMLSDPANKGKIPEAIRKSSQFQFELTLAMGRAEMLSAQSQNGEGIEAASIVQDALVTYLQKTHLSEEGLDVRMVNPSPKVASAINEGALKAGKKLYETLKGTNSEQAKELQKILHQIDENRKSKKSIAKDILMMVMLIGGEPMLKMFGVDLRRL